MHALVGHGPDQNLCSRLRSVQWQNQSWYHILLLPCAEKLMFVTANTSVKSLLLLFLQSWDIKCLTLPDRSIEKKAGYSLSSLMYLYCFHALSHRKHRWHEICNEACQDICWSPWWTMLSLQDIRLNLGVPITALITRNYPLPVT